eukprot:4813910-Amphidinium_carterae.1
MDMWTRQGELSKVDALLRDIFVPIGWKPDTVYYKRFKEHKKYMRAQFNLLLKACQSSANLALAKRIFKEMEHRRIDASPRTYGKLLGIAIAAEDMSQAEAWTQLSLERGYFKNDTVVLSMLINALAERAEVERASHWFEVAQQWNISVDCWLYGAMIQAYMRGGRERDALTLFSEATESGMNMDST